MLIYIFFLTVIKRVFLSLQENSSRVLQTGIVVISLYRFAYRIKILLTNRLGEAISEAIFSFYIIIRCVYAGWPQGSPLRKRYKGCSARQAGDRKGRPYGGLHEVRWGGRTEAARPYENVL